NPNSEIALEIRFIPCLCWRILRSSRISSSLGQSRRSSAGITYAGLRNCFAPSPCRFQLHPVTFLAWLFTSAFVVTALQLCSRPTCSHGSERDLHARTHGR